ncbi:hypothetical protein EVAR_95611_1 [Eumeta japonica]|uniref:Uncharacterized protein n=1 Tax=Eumeta variegata TaxID=151549 RepID=A0A4C1VKD0_EUMVA|nr:hypothetical protein EVAR_95611_1 [Eumeta japonica]
MESESASSESRAKDINFESKTGNDFLLACPFGSLKCLLSSDLLPARPLAGFSINSWSAHFTNADSHKTGPASIAQAKKRSGQPCRSPRNAGAPDKFAD